MYKNMSNINGIYMTRVVNGEGRIQIHLNSPGAIDPLAQDPGYTASILI